VNSFVIASALRRGMSSKRKNVRLFVNVLQIPQHKCCSDSIIKGAQARTAATHVWSLATQHASWYSKSVFAKYMDHALEELDGYPY